MKSKQNGVPGCWPVIVTVIGAEVLPLPTGGLNGITLGDIEGSGRISTDAGTPELLVNVKVHAYCPRSCAFGFCAFGGGWGGPQHRTQHHAGNHQGRRQQSGIAAIGDGANESTKACSARTFNV
jgi:hypothetical protein